MAFPVLAKLEVQAISKDGKVLRVKLSDGSSTSIPRNEVKHNKKEKVTA